jgi:hypothetical protein
MLEKPKKKPARRLQNADVKRPARGLILRGTIDFDAPNELIVEGGIDLDEFGNEVDEYRRRLIAEHSHDPDELKKQMDEGGRRLMEKYEAQFKALSEAKVRDFREKLHQKTLAEHHARHTGEVMRAAKAAKKTKSLQIRAKFAAKAATGERLQYKLYDELKAALKAARLRTITLRQFQRDVVDYRRGKLTTFL